MQHQDKIAQSLDPTGAFSSLILNVTSVTFRTIRLKVLFTNTCSPQKLASVLTYLAQTKQCTKQWNWSFASSAHNQSALRRFQIQAILMWSTCSKPSVPAPSQRFSLESEVWTSNLRKAASCQRFHTVWPEMTSLPQHEL